MSFKLLSDFFSSSDLNKRLTCIFPFPAWPKFTILIPYFSESFFKFINNVVKLDIGTAISSFILYPPISRSAGDSDFLANHSFSISDLLLATVIFLYLF